MKLLVLIIPGAVAVYLVEQVAHALNTIGGAL